MTDLGTADKHEYSTRIQGCRYDADEIEALRAQCAEADALLLDCWQQFSLFRGVHQRWDGGLSALEDVHDYLRQHALIDDKGLPTARAEDGRRDCGA